jgi:hypothetical protein
MNRPSPGATQGPFLNSGRSTKTFKSNVRASCPSGPSLRVSLPTPIGIRWATIKDSPSQQTAKGFLVTVRRKANPLPARSAYRWQIILPAGDPVPTLDDHCEALRQLTGDIADALPDEMSRDDMRARLEEVLPESADPDGELYFGVLLRMAWRAKDAPTLAQRVIDRKAQIFGDPKPLGYIKDQHEQL